MTDRIEALFLLIFLGWVAALLVLACIAVYQCWAFGRELDRERDGLDLGDNP